jgi:zinc transport system ATP-binding protein
MREKEIEQREKEAENRSFMGSHLPMDLPFLEVKNLGVRYGNDWVLKEVSFRIMRGELTCVIGPNGAGKSTLLKALMGLVKMDSGEIVSRAERIGYVPQQLRIDPVVPLRVDEFLSLKLSQKPVWFGAGATVKAAKSKLEEMGASHLLKRRIGQLSGGEFQRVLIAYALLNEPDLLLLDEPMSGLDIRGGLSLDSLLHHLHNDKRMTILMVSHDLHLVEHIGDQVLCIYRSVCCHGDPRIVLRPEHLAKIYSCNDND